VPTPWPRPTAGAAAGVGLALLATVTSLPELASGISAVAWVDAPNLAVGNALGACVVNLLFLVVVDALQRRQPMYREASQTHLLSAGFGVVMLGFVALSLLIGGRVPALMHVGVYSPMLLGRECRAGLPGRGLIPLSRTAGGRSRCSMSTASRAT
jgi:Ca2+/Na+ antiporter